jgi:uncharacterized protein YecE (DUF72 family)
MAALYYLGCPVWACEKWHGSLYTRNARQSEWLGEYSRVFNTVEGNSTFYGLPSHDTIRRWADSVEEGFRFALKFPRSISHEKRLLEAEKETEAFLEILEILTGAGRLGPAFLQLPNGFSGHHTEDLVRYLEQLPPHFQYAVELRHHDFFDGGKAELQLNRSLAELQIDRVILDSRSLFSAPPEDEFERISQGRKPQLPVRPVLTGTHPLLRLIGRDDIRRVAPWILEWSRTVAKWIHGGLTPYIFTHTPDERFAPQLARMFHDELARHVHDVGPLAAFPGEGDARQLRLF